METNKTSLNITDVYNKYYSEILYLVTMKVRKVELAEDLTSDVFIRAYNHLASFDSNKCTIKSWLIAISNNAIIDYYRLSQTKTNINFSDLAKVNSENEVISFDSVSDYKTDNLINAKEFNHKIDAIFNSMKPNYQKVAELYFKKDMSYNDIAAICEIPLGSVKGMINRCKVLLQSNLQAEKAEYGIK